MGYGPDRYRGFMNEAVQGMHEAPRAHRAHTTALRVVDQLVGDAGIRRFPGGNVIITSPEVGRKVLSADHTVLPKKGTINRAIGATVGAESLLSSDAADHPEATLETREKLVRFFRKTKEEYLEGVEAGTQALCDQIIENGGIGDIYDRIHGVFIGGLMNTFGEPDISDDPQLQQEIVGLSSELGAKSILGPKLGEKVLSRTKGLPDDRNQTINERLDSITERNAGFWDITTDDPDAEAMRSNMMLLFGAGTTSTAGVVGWTLYDAAYSQRDKDIITNGGSKADIVNLMARTLDRHPFGYVINRDVAEDFDVDGFSFREGDKAWFVTVPERSDATNTNELFGISFSAGDRDCLGKSIAIGSYVSFMQAWGERIKDWDISHKPKSPLYLPTLKPKKMGIAVAS